MKNITILVNHFEGKTTVVAGNWCHNGCQIFHKSRAQEVFNAFNVPQRYRDDVLLMFRDEPVDYKEISKCIDDTIVIVICEDINFLRERNFVKSPYWQERRALARKNILEFNLVLMHDEDPTVRHSVAAHTDSLEILEHMANNDAHHIIRCQAKYLFDQKSKDL